MTVTSFAVALDWTPNTNHVGFYVSQAKGWYAEAELQLSLHSPHEDGYSTTPADCVLSGSADFAVAPSETAVSLNTLPESSSKRPLTAVAALLQQDTSAIVTTDPGLTRPRTLEGKVYASYGARYEGRLVQQMIKNDGGSGDFTESTPAKLGVWDTVLSGKADATWVFMGWEGVQAELRGIKLNAFRLQDYGIPYGYSPVVLADPSMLRDKPEAVRAFLEATARGYSFAAQHPNEAADLLLKQAEVEHGSMPLPEPLDKELVHKSMACIAQDILSKDGRWGVMETQRWDAFLDWLSESGLLTSKVQSRQPALANSTTLDGLRQGDVGETIPRNLVATSSLFTNDFLPGST